MTLDFVQNAKELFSAHFEVLHHGQIIGQMSLTQASPLHRTWSGQCFGREISMTDIPRKTAGLTGKILWPYSIAINSCEIGTVYQTRYKAGLLHSFDYVQMRLAGRQYDLFSIGFGKDGAKAPIYCGDRQRALMEKPAVVYNDLHCYHITAADQDDGLAALLFCCYLYASSAFRAGNKVVRSVEKNYTHTTNKRLLEKYDPLFKELYTDKN